MCVYVFMCVYGRMEDGGWIEGWVDGWSDGLEDKSVGERGCTDA